MTRTRLRKTLRSDNIKIQHDQLATLALWKAFFLTNYVVSISATSSGTSAVSSSYLYTKDLQINISRNYDKGVTFSKPAKRDGIK